MFTFLFDILPETGHVRFTLELAFLLHKKGYEVYYTDSSDSVFTSGLLQKGIGRIIYPGDFRWFTPDLVLLDVLLQPKIAFYRRHGIKIVFVAMWYLGVHPGEHTVIPIVYLPPSGYTVPLSSPRLEYLSDLLSVWKKKPSQVVIAGLLEIGEDARHFLSFYNMIKESCITNAHYQIILLTNSREAVKQLFPLPSNMALYRLLDLPALLPGCDVALTTGDLNTLIESVHARLPALAYPISEQTEHYRNALQYVQLGLGIYGEIKKTTSEVFEQQIAKVLKNKQTIQEKSGQICERFESENRNLEQVVERLITFIQQDTDEISFL